MAEPEDYTPFAFLTDSELRQNLNHAVLEIGEWLDDRETSRGGRKADRLLDLAEEVHRRVEAEIDSRNPQGMPL